MKNSSSRLLTTKEILEQYPCCGRTKLYSHLEDGSLKSIRWGRKYLVRSEDWEAFLEANEHTVGN